MIELININKSFGQKSLFTKFIDGMDELKKFISYSVSENDYIYHVKCPSYPTFTGNLAVSITGANEYNLIIWPSRFKDTEYGVMIPIENNSFTSIIINENLKSEDEYDQPLVDENKENIKDLFRKAAKRWGIK